MPLGRRQRRVTLAAVASLAALYAGGYALARGNHWLVHRSGFAHGHTVTNYIAAGDFGVGLHPVPEASYVVFTPLRWAEAVYWHVRPKGGV